MSSLSIRVGLVDLTDSIDREMMSAVAAALNVQVTRDLPQYWNVRATVTYLPDKNKIPQGVWPVQLVKKLPPHEGGVHLTKHNQPYAKVIASPDSDAWTLDASHETIEMLVDPSGNLLHASTAIRISGDKVVDASGKFEYLVEACDPCEADQFGYEIDGFLVSDFITPNYYAPHAVAGTRYSFNGSIARPRQLLEGGYISFVDIEQDALKQILWVDPSQPPQMRTLGVASGASLRAFVESNTRPLADEQRAKRRAADTGISTRFKEHRDVLGASARARAKLYT